MKEIEMYKEFYFREIDRKHELNNSINNPIVIIAALIGLHAFIFSQDGLQWGLVFKIIAAISFCFILYAIFYLGKSFGNLGKSHTYRELSSMDNLKKYKSQLEEAEDTRKADKIFSSYLEDEFAACSSHNFSINKVRTEDMARAKRGILLSVFSSIAFSITYIVSLII